jgi:signal peptidase I
MIRTVTIGLIGALGLCLLSCARPPLETLNGAAMFPNMRPQARCRVERPAIALERGHVAVVTIGERSVARRVVGLPGDTVALVRGLIHVNGVGISRSVTRDETTCRAGVSARCVCQIMTEIHGGRDIKIQVLHPTDAGDDFRCDTPPPLSSPAVTVPDGHYYLVADNRDAASDSRTLGPLNAITGRVMTCRYNR